MQKLISFLLGLSWGAAFFAFITVFFSYNQYGFFTAVVLATLAFLFVMLFVVFLEYMNFKVASALRVEQKLDKLIAVHDKLPHH